MHQMELNVLSWNWIAVVKNLNSAFVVKSIIFSGMTEING